MKNRQKCEIDWPKILLVSLVLVGGVALYFWYVVLPASLAKARDTKRKSDLMMLQSTLELYWADKGFYPIGSEEREVVGVNSRLAGLLVPEYIANIPEEVYVLANKDWSPYLYWQTQEGKYYLFTSLEKAEKAGKREKPVLPDDLGGVKDENGVWINYQGKDYFYNWWIEGGAGGVNGMQGSVEDSDEKEWGVMRGCGLDKVIPKEVGELVNCAYGSVSGYSAMNLFVVDKLENGTSQFRLFELTGTDIKGLDSQEQLKLVYTENIRGDGLVALVENLGRVAVGRFDDKDHLQEVGLIIRGPEGYVLKWKI